MAKISDFGISKTFDANKTQVTQTSIKGTVGYRAPEILKGEKISKRADIFSLGITFFFVLSEGEHPYGSDVLKIECAIRDGEAPNLNGLGDFEHDATTLILSMIAHEPDDRPVINEIQEHHIFWSDKKKVRFIQEVSDYCIAGDNFDAMQRILEAKIEEIVGNWRESISDPVVKKVLENMKNKRQGDGVCDLLRNIRNLKSHYIEKPPNFHEIVGEKPPGLAKWFTQEFPKLLPYVYETMKCRKEDSWLKEYYYMKTKANQKFFATMEDQPPSNLEAIEAMEDNETSLAVLGNCQGQTPEASSSQIVRPPGTMMQTNPGPSMQPAVQPVMIGPNSFPAQPMPGVPPGQLAVSQGMMPQFNPTMLQPVHSAFPQGMQSPSLLPQQQMMQSTVPMAPQGHPSPMMSNACTAPPRIVAPPTNVGSQPMREIDEWNESIHFDWGDVLRPLLNKAGGVAEFVENERRRIKTNPLKNPAIQVCPPACEVFFWTQFFNIRDVKVVILGHDPYPQFRKAHGLAFSVRHGWSGEKKNQRDSLHNIFEAVKKDYPYFVDPGHHNLTEWAKQGVLLLNCLLTVCGKPGSHAGRGWEEITDEVIKYISKNVPSVVFLIWGKDAEKKIGQIDNVKYHRNPIKWKDLKAQTGKSEQTLEKEIKEAVENGMKEAVDCYRESEPQEYRCHSVIVSSHPDPRSAAIDFLHTNHFSLANKWLELNGRNPINWTKL